MEDNLDFHISPLGLIYNQIFRPNIEIMIWQLCQHFFAIVKFETLMVNYQDIIEASSCLGKVYVFML